MATKAKYVAHAKLLYRKCKLMHPLSPNLA